MIELFAMMGMLVINLSALIYVFCSYKTLEANLLVKINNLRNDTDRDLEQLELNCNELQKTVCELRESIALNEEWEKKLRDNMDMYGEGILEKVKL